MFYIYGGPDHRAVDGHDERAAEADNYRDQPGPVLAVTGVLATLPTERREDEANERPDPHLIGPAGRVVMFGLDQNDDSKDEPRNNAADEGNGKADETGDTGGFGSGAHVCRRIVAVLLFF